MPGGLRNQPKVFRGAFVEYGLTIPPLVVVFQFNPLQLSRSRRQEFSMTASAQAVGRRVRSDPERFSPGLQRSPEVARRPVRHHASGIPRF